MLAALFERRWTPRGCAHDDVPRRCCYAVGMAVRNKDLERRLAAKFRATRPDLVPGELEESESPDFLFMGRDGLRIGIEVTELFHSDLAGGDPQQAQAARAYGIVQRARARHETLGGTPLHVDVVFDPSFDLHRDDEPRLVEAIVHIVRRNIPPPGQIEEEVFTWENRGYFPQEIFSILIARYDDQDRGYWTGDRGAMYTPPLTVERLVVAVLKKSQKTSNYRGRCDRIWLLIATDVRLTSTWTLDEGKVGDATSGDFDRVFILHDDKAHELWPRSTVEGADEPATRPCGASELR